MKKDFAADGNAIFSEFLECIVIVQVEIVQIIKADIKPRTYPLYIPSIFFHSREVYKKYRRLNIKRQDNSRTNERRAEMFLYERQRTIINLDAVKDIFPGREPGSLAVSFMSGITSKISVYNSEIEAKKAIEMIAEQMATGKAAVIRVPAAEEVRARLKNTRLLTEHHATGKKTKGHGGS